MKIKQLRRMDDLKSIFAGDLMHIKNNNIADGTGVYIGIRKGRNLFEPGEFPVFIRRDILKIVKGEEHSKKSIVEQLLYPYEEKSIYPHEKDRLNIFEGESKEISCNSNLHDLYNQMLNERYDKFLANYIKKFWSNS